MKAGQTAGGFADVSDDNIFKNDIQWMADIGITKGCNPPTNDRFCPSSVVTRESMSAFMHRLGVNKVVDAKTAITADTATKADTATTASNADKLDGLHASQLTRIDGAIGSSVAAIGTAQTVVQMAVTAPTAGLLAITGSVALEDQCSVAGTSMGILGIMVNNVVVTASATYLADCTLEWNSSDISATTVAVEVPAGVSIVELRVAGFESVVFAGQSSLSSVFSPFGSGASLAGTQTGIISQSQHPVDMSILRKNG
jgi:hypothetical protein